MSARSWLAGLPLMTALLVASIAVVPGAARAQPAAPAPPPTVTADLLEVSAKTGAPPSIDPDLKPLQKKLKKPPFSSWNQFKLLMKAQEKLVKRKPANIKLKHGKATVTLVEIVDKSKCRLSVTIEDEKGKQIVNNTSTVEGGDYLVYGHSLPNNDGHLLALTCK